MRASNSSAVPAFLFAVAFAAVPALAGDGPVVVRDLGKLVPDDVAAGDWFGYSAAVDGEFAVVGARFGGPDDSGLAYVLQRTGGVWQHVQSLTYSPAMNGARFGASVGILGDTIVVGAPGFTSGGAAQRGAAFVFVRGPVEWKHAQTVVGSDAGLGAECGSDVAIDGEWLAVGARFANGPNTYTGAVYIFQLQGTTWVETQKVLHPQPQYESEFGFAVALDGPRLLVGAPLLAHHSLAGARAEGSFTQDIDRAA